jgi:SAM-dependent methyltransferase
MAAAKRRAHLDLLERWLPDLTGAVLLKTDLWEEGVAGDELLFTLAERSGRALGIDLSPLVVSAAGEAANCDRLDLGLVSADVCNLPFRNDTFHVVLSTSTLDHLDRSGYVQALSEIHRVLAPGGVLVLTFDNADNVTARLLDLVDRLGLLPFSVSSSLSLSELRAELSRSGFSVSEGTYIVHGPRILTTLSVRVARLLPATCSSRVVQQLLRVFNAMGRQWPRRLGSFVAVRATKPAAA